MLATKIIAQGSARSMTLDNSQHPEEILQNIWPQLKNNQLDQALIMSTQLCDVFPDFPQGWHVASMVSMRQGKIGSALQQIQQALNLVPNNDHWHLHQARLFLIDGQKNEALELAKTLTLSSEQSINFLAELALILNKLGVHQQSLDTYQRALNLQHNNAQLWFNLASVQRFMGKLKCAQHSLDKVIQLNPQDNEAWLLRSSLCKQTLASNHISELQQQLAKPHSPIATAQLYYGLGKELEDVSRFPEAFEALQQGATTRRAHMQYNVENDLQVLRKITEVFNTKRLTQDDSGYVSKAPIFILGLPRTGSTLVERIIANHTDVFSAGELNNFALQMMQQVRQRLAAPPANKLALIEACSQLDFAQLGQDYIESTAPETDVNPRFIDKLPLNSLYVGLIHLALPKAKIIYVQRHPMDTFFAIFKQCFTDGYPFSYDLNELCQYQIAHHKLMTHWQQTLGSKLYAVSYEKLVKDIQGETRKLLKHCDLPWQPQCCQFEQNAAASTTASAAQVRQPLYTSSIGKWKQFSRQLSAVKQRFEQAGITCD